VGIMGNTKHTCVRFVTVPNAGRFAGLPFCIVNFKVSIGHRAGFFLDAIDDDMMRASPKYWAQCPVPERQAGLDD
jgi:hypothetical protein